MTTFGCTDMVGELRRVLVRRPREAETAAWRDFGWRAEPDPAELVREHEALCAILEDAGAEVVLADERDGRFEGRGNAPDGGPETRDGGPDAPAGGLDSIYAFDAALVTEHGAILMRPGKAVRHAEPEALLPTLERAGVPVAGQLEGDQHAEGGDLIRLDERTLLAGRGYRTDSDGIWALERLTGLETLVFDLPYWHGPAEVMHLLSLLSPLAPDLVVAYRPLLPVRLAQLLDERVIEVVPVPDEEFDTMGSNVLALGRRRALVVDGNPVTRRRLEAAGVDVSVYRGRELSKGDGGPTCLTLPLLRAAS